MDCKYDWSGENGWCLTCDEPSATCKERKALHYGWVGFDFDGTIADHSSWGGEFEFGKAIPSMIMRMKCILALGYEVKIVTARMCEPELADRMKSAIQDWLEKEGLPRLDVTCQKDYRMICLYDDRAVSVVTNTGQINGEDKFFGADIAKFEKGLIL